MNQSQVNHLNEILEWVKREVTEKYVAGTIEHKSNLGTDYSITELGQMKADEVKDLITYTYTHDKAVNELVKRVKESLQLCEEENGMRLCKNCGLSDEGIKL
jgi:ferredoxin-thioredoxin reductase catalytic subunit